MNMTVEKKGNQKAPVWLIIAAVVFVAVFVVWMMNSDIEPIPDTNGPDDYSLAVITDENIINRDMGAVNPATVKRTNLTVGGLDLDPTVKISSKDFSGVYQVLHTNYIYPSDLTVYLMHLKVNSGNFKMAVVLDDKIVGVIEPSDESIEFILEDIGGDFSLVIAGESAEYEFEMWKHDYDRFAN